MSKTTNNATGAKTGAIKASRSLKKVHFQSRYKHFNLNCNSAKVDNALKDNKIYTMEDEIKTILLPITPFLESQPDCLRVHMQSTAIEMLDCADKVINKKETLKKFQVDLSYVPRSAKFGFTLTCSKELAEDQPYRAFAKSCDVAIKKMQMELHTNIKKLLEHELDRFKTMHATTFTECAFHLTLGLIICHRNNNGTTFKRTIDEKLIAKMALCAYFKGDEVNLTTYFDSKLQSLFKILHKTTNTFIHTKTPAQEETSTQNQENLLTETTTNTEKPTTTATAKRNDQPKEQKLQSPPPINTIITKGTTSVNQYNNPIPQPSIISETNNNGNTNQLQSKLGTNAQNSIDNTRRTPPINKYKKSPTNITPDTNTINMNTQGQLQQLLQSSVDSPSNLLTIIQSLVQMNNNNPTTNNTNGSNNTNQTSSIRSAQTLGSNTTITSAPTNQFSQDVDESLYDGIDFTEEFYHPDHDCESIATVKDANNGAIIKNIAAQLHNIIPKLSYELLTYHTKENADNLAKAEVNAYFESIKTSNTTMEVAKIFEKEDHANHKTIRRLIQQQFADEFSKMQKNLRGGAPDRMLPPLPRGQSDQHKFTPPTVNGKKWTPPTSVQQTQTTSPYHYAGNPNLQNQHTTDQFYRQHRNKSKKQNDRRNRNSIHSYRKRYQQR